jgi:hypothetical protein
MLAESYGSASRGNYEKSSLKAYISGGNIIILGHMSTTCGKQKNLSEFKVTIFHSRE